MKRNTPCKIVAIWASGVLLSLVLDFGAGRVQAAVTAGGTAPNFTVQNHSTGQPLRLYPYQGHIVVLDFWAYWCGPCRLAAADIEPNIAEYYRRSGGNINGVPVVVMSISVDMSDPVSENNYIQTYGLDLVGDDTTGATYSAYGNGYIPYLVVINGTTNSSNYRAWEVLYGDAGYASGSTVPTMKARIDSVQTPPPVPAVTAPAPGAVVPPGEVTLSATVTNKGKIIKKVEFYNGASLIGYTTNATLSLTTNASCSITWSNPPVGEKSVTARAYYGSSSRADSAVVSFTVGVPEPVSARLIGEGANLVLEWTGGPGLFRVQMATDLSRQDWQYVTAAATNTSLILIPTNTAAFYRVVRQ